MNYSAMRALASTMITDGGFLATISGAATAPDPVTGLGGGAGATRTIPAVLTKVDTKLFPQSLVHSEDRMLVCAGAVEVGETWGGRAIVDVLAVTPDNGAPIITKAVVR